MSSERHSSCHGSYPPRILVDATSPLVARRRRRAAITVSVRGSPAPRVTWYVGRNRKPVTSGDERWRCDQDGEGRHTLTVTSASSLLDDGVWVVASNVVGQDRCLIDVKTYRGSRQNTLSQWFVGERFTNIRPMLSDRRPICLSCLSCLSLCDVGMYCGQTCHAGRPRPWQHSVRWGPSPLPKGAEPTIFSAHICCRQMAGWVTMRLGMEVGLAPGDFVLAGDPALPRQKGADPQFSAYFYCGQTTGCTKMPLGMEVGLGSGDFVFDGAQLPPEKGHTHPNPVLADVYCGQTAGWMKTPLSTEVDPP